MILYICGREDISSISLPGGLYLKFAINELEIRMCNLFTLMVFVEEVLVGAEKYIDRVHEIDMLGGGCLTASVHAPKMAKMV